MWISAVLSAAARPFAAAAGAVVAAAVVSPAYGDEPRPPIGTAPAQERFENWRDAFDDRLRREGAAYDARTDNLSESGAPKFLNRLILQTSPYLRQHAHNPVDWLPWGDDALAAAQAADKPIFLSVGYATCHWCHVMARESFDHPGVAEALNKGFIAIKLDREERPDVDEAYMTATFILQGAGGWPNSVFLTPDGAPFLAATYLPRDAFLETLDAVATTWRQDRGQITTVAAQVGGAIRQYNALREAAAPVDEAAHAAALAELTAQHNSLSGGFSQSAQFPRAVILRYLLDRWRRDGDASARDMALGTLDAILAGALHDHVGGGFHRYTVDPTWSTPHFEKMLYTQGLLGQVLIEAYEATGRVAYARGARRLFAYVLRDMTAPDGAFYAAEDAESRAADAAEKIEGAYYLWDAQEAAGLVGAETAEALGLTIPTLLEGGAPTKTDVDALDDLSRFDAALQALAEARAERPRPLRDDKVIAAWNGLMIAALADGAAALDQPELAAAAERAADAVWARLWRDDRLFRVSAAGADPNVPGKLQDYAWLGLGYLALWDSVGAPRHLARARLLADQIEPRFADASGRLKMSEVEGPLGPIFAHEDGATPAGESSAMELFARLAWRERGYDNHERALRLFGAVSGALAARPADRVGALAAAAMLQEGESRARRAMAMGKVAAHAMRLGDEVRLRLRIADGWHVNAHQPLSEMLIPTTLHGAGLGAARYPDPVEVNLGFQNEPLAVLEGDVEIVAPIEAADGDLVAQLTLQACSDEICLQPQSVEFRFAER